MSTGTQASDGFVSFLLYVPEYFFPSGIKSLMPMKFSFILHLLFLLIAVVLSWPLKSYLHLKVMS